MKHICEQCGQEFQAPQSQGARFCDRDCYDKFRRGVYKCDFCGKTFERFKSRAKRYKHNFCSPECHQKYIDDDVRRHPNFKNGITSYRKIIEQEIGRPLKPNEIIHHKNGDRTDNRIENLVITNRSEHPNLHPEVGFQEGHKVRNTGKTRFKKGVTPWNKGK
jgi:hypothetical protein